MGERRKLRTTKVVLILLNLVLAAALATRASAARSTQGNSTGAMPKTLTGYRTWMGAMGRAMLPWYLLFVVGMLLLDFGWPPHEWSATLLRWLWRVTEDTALVLPFLTFAAGVALVRVLWDPRRLIRTAVGVGISAGAVSYALGAWVAPEVHNRLLANLGVETTDIRRFGPRTPPGVLENLRFVEGNPPDEYTLSVSAPHRFPPNVLRWELHGPAAMAVFGVINVLLGVLAARLTVDLNRRAQRNSRLAIGVIGGIAFFGCLVLASPVEPFLRDGTMRSGILGAWGPLFFPLVEASVLLHLVRRREHRRPRPRSPTYLRR